MRKALKAGAQVFFSYHQDKTLSEELIQLGAVGFSLDLSQSSQIIETAKKLREKIEHVDILIHNAALTRDRTLQNLTADDWDTVLNVDLKAPYLLTKELMPLLFLRKSKDKNVKIPATKIFFITSRVAFGGGIGISNYAAAKAGLIGLTKSLAQELGKRNILVNAVNPGFMKSKMTAGLPEAVIQANLDMSPLSRISSPEEVADFLVYLSSDNMQQVTGQVFSFESRKT